MKKTTNRREFLSKGATVFMACGVLGLCPQLKGMGFLLGDKDIPDPKKLEYCGYQCPPDCPLYVATIENNEENKKEAYEMWKIKERYNLDFDPEQVFCYQCKNEGQPEGVVVKNCQVRKCVIEKGYECCIECKELPACDKELWKQFPEFHKAVIEMQHKYMEAKT